ncbi:MAG: hypothetical protein ACE5IP_00825 [Terriglobia bacterium]
MAEHRRPERGRGRFNTLLALLLTAAVVLVGVRVGPVYFHSYQFRDAMRSEAKFARVNDKAAAVIQRDLYRKAQELSLPLTRKQIRVVQQRLGVRIAARYEVPVDLILYRTTLSFDFSADSASTF